MNKNFVYDLLRAWMLPLKAINQATPKRGRIVELGCGEGVIARYLARNSNREVIGVDINKKRILKTKSSNVNFVHADIRIYPLKKINGVVISDVLHHMNFFDQEKLLKNIVVSLPKKGVLVIKEIDTSDFFRSKLSRFWDFVFYPKERVYFSSSKRMIPFLKQLGFKIEYKKAAKFFPGSTNLYICQKR